MEKLHLVIKLKFYLILKYFFFLGARNLVLRYLLLPLISTLSLKNGNCRIYSFSNSNKYLVDLSFFFCVVLVRQSNVFSVKSFQLFLFVSDEEATFWLW